MVSANVSKPYFQENTCKKHVQTELDKILSWGYISSREKCTVQIPNFVWGSIETITSILFHSKLYFYLLISPNLIWIPYFQFIMNLIFILLNWNFHNPPSNMNTGISVFRKKSNLDVICWINLNDFGLNEFESLDFRANDPLQSTK